MQIGDLMVSWCGAIAGVPPAPTGGSGNAWTSNLTGTVSTHEGVTFSRLAATSDPGATFTYTTAIKRPETDASSQHSEMSVRRLT